MDRQGDGIFLSLRSLRLSRLRSLRIFSLPLSRFREKMTPLREHPVPLPLDKNRFWTGLIFIIALIAFKFPNKNSRFAPPNNIKTSEDGHGGLLSKKKAWLHHAMQSRRQGRAEGLLRNRPWLWQWHKLRSFRRPPHVAASFESVLKPGLF